MNAKTREMKGKYVDNAINILLNSSLIAEVRPISTFTSTSASSFLLILFFLLPNRELTWHSRKLLMSRCQSTMESSRDMLPLLSWRDAELVEQVGKQQGLYMFHSTVSPGFAVDNCVACERALKVFPPCSRMDEN